MTQMLEQIAERGPAPNDRRLTLERARELLAYDSETGILTWRMRRGSAGAGSPAGTLHSKGYLLVRVDGVRFLAHRLAWLLAHGEWPRGEIDHTDGEPSNNRITNLRVVTRTQNNINTKLSRNNTSGITGVIWDRRKRKWWAQLKLYGRLKHLGYFTSKEEAETARLQAAVAHVGGPIRAQTRRTSRDV
jgi:HNH endonuclease